MIQFIKYKVYRSKSLQRAVSFIDFTGSGEAIVIDEDGVNHTVSITDLFE